MEAVPTMRKFVVAGAVAVIAALATGSGAYADCSGPSSVQQYVECPPTATGSNGKSTKSTRKVPKSLQTKIDKQGGQDAQQLQAMVSQSKYGAPTSTPIKVHKVAKAKTHKAKKEVAKKKILSDSATRKSNPLTASVNVITDGSDGRLIALIVLMLGVAAFVIVSALRKRRVTR